MSSAIECYVPIQCLIVILISCCCLMFIFCFRFCFCLEMLYLLKSLSLLARLHFQFVFANYLSTIDGVKSGTRNLFTSTVDNKMCRVSSACIFYQKFQLVVRNIFFQLSRQFCVLHSLYFRQSTQNGHFSLSNSIEVYK